MRENQSFETLKSIFKISNESKQFEWIKIPNNINYESLLILERLDLIFTKDHSHFVFLLGFDILKKLLDDLDKK
jgi:hypothetical protein